jgi:hypothetical protein
MEICIFQQRHVYEKEVLIHIYHILKELFDTKCLSNRKIYLKSRTLSLHNTPQKIKHGNGDI